MDGARLEEAPKRWRRFLGVDGAGAAGVHEASAGRRGVPSVRDASAIESIVMAGFSAELGAAAADAASAVARHMVAQANDALSRLEMGAQDNEFTTSELFALESVIRARGRPALRFLRHDIEPIVEDRHPDCGFWRVLVDEHRAPIVRAAQTCGAVLVRDQQGVTGASVHGSAWLAGADLVVTNRHVLEPKTPMDGPTLIERRPGEPTKAFFLDRYDVTVDFTYDNSGPSNAICNALEPVFVAERGDPIDVAVLRISAPEPRVDALSIADAPASKRFLVVVGHPAPNPYMNDDVRAVFDQLDGRKRLSFGEFIKSDDPRDSHVHLHDASTVGGFSGGCLLVLGENEVAAVHYYGSVLRGNRALRASAIKTHTVGAILAGSGHGPHG
jgi:hypothetical protein